jgi:hypothetical protein
VIHLSSGFASKLCDAGIIFRIGIAVGNASLITQLNATEYALTGASRFTFNSE